MMQQIFKLFFICFFGIVFISCGGDKEDDSIESVENREKILGVWALTETETNGVVDDNSTTCKLNNSLEFERSGVYVNTVSGVNCSTNESRYEDYSINGAVLRVGETTVDILILNTTTLKVEYRERNSYVETYTKKRV